MLISKHIAKAQYHAEKLDFRDALQSYSEAIQYLKTGAVSLEDENVARAYSGACYCHIKLNQPKQAICLSEEYRSRKVSIALQHTDYEGLGPGWYKDFDRLIGPSDSIEQFYLNTWPETENVAILYYMFEPRFACIVTIQIRKRALSFSENVLQKNDLDKLYNEYRKLSEMMVDSRPMQEIIDLLTTLLLPQPESINIPGDTLLIVPDPRLEWVPWDLLKYNDSYLGLQIPYAISYSLDLARIAICRNRTTSVRPTNSAVLFGDSLGDKPEALNEIKEVAALLKHVGVKTYSFLQNKATVRRFDKGWSVDVLHYAGHAESGSKLKFSDGELTESDIERLSFSSGPLVILNACESGLSERTGGEMMGIVRGFILAGANAVLATKWLTDDETARLLICIVYASLASGKTIVDALLDARKYVNKIPDTTFFDWGCHTLYGAPWVNPLLRDVVVDEDMIFSILTYAGGPDHRGSDDALMILDKLVEKHSVLITNTLVKALSEYEDWHVGQWSTSRAFLERLEDSIYGCTVYSRELYRLENVRPFEKAMYELLLLEDEDILESSSRTEAINMFPTIAMRYLNDGQDSALTDLTRELISIIETTIDRSGDSDLEIEEIAQKVLIDIGKEKPDIVVEVVVQTVTTKWDWMAPEDYVDLLINLSEDIPHIRKSEALLDFLIDRLDDFIDSNEGKQIIDIFEDELRERLISRLGPDRLRLIAENSGLTGTFNMDTEELIGKVIDELQELSIEDLCDRLEEQ